MSNSDKPSTKEAIHWIMDNMNIVDFLKYRGYEIDKSRNCTRYTAMTLGGAEKLVVPRRKDGGVPSRYFDQYEKRGKSIIDFVMERDNLDIHGAIELLLEHAMRADFVPYRASPEEQQREKKIKAMRRAHQRYIKKFMEARPDLLDPSYLLEERMISADTLQHRTFRNRVWNAYYDEADRICFPFYGSDNTVVALSFKSVGYGKVIGRKADGVWVSQPTRSNTLPVDKLFIVEHPLNAMAHFEMRHNPEENNLYVSVMGSPAWSQLDLIQKGIDKRQPGQVILAHDRDQPKIIPGKNGSEDRIIPAAGEVYDTKLSEYLTHHHPLVILKPETGSDFNDELKAYKRSNFGCQREPELLPMLENEPLLFRLAKVASNYYQTHTYQPTAEDRQLFVQQNPAEPQEVANEYCPDLKRFAVLRNFPYQVMAYMRGRLKDSEFSLFIQLMEIS